MCKQLNEHLLKFIKITQFIKISYVNKLQKNKSSAKKCFYYVQATEWSGFKNHLK